MGIGAGRDPSGAACANVAEGLALRLCEPEVSVWGFGWFAFGFDYFPEISTDTRELEDNISRVRYASGRAVREPV